MLPPTTTLVLLLLALALFVVGVLLGWMFSDHADTPTSSKLKTLVAVAVTLVWISATIADILVTAYTVSPLLHALMGGIVGYFFTDEGISLNLGANNDE